MSKRTDIRDAFAQLISDCSSLAEVKVEFFNVPDLETMGYPCAFVFLDAETKIQAPGLPFPAVIGEETWKLDLTVEVWARLTDDLEGCLKDIHEAVFADRTLGGMVETVERMSTNSVLVNPDTRAMLIQFSLWYRHPKGDMQ